jgi:hypothetical protein
MHAQRVEIKKEESDRVRKKIDDGDDDGKCLFVC